MRFAKVVKKQIIFCANSRLEHDFHSQVKKNRTNLCQKSTKPTSQLLSIPQIIPLQKPPQNHPSLHFQNPFSFP